MRNISVLFVGLAWVALVLVASCSRTNEAEIEQEKDRLLGEVNTALSNVNSEITALQQELSGAMSDRAQKINDHISSLERVRDDLQTNLDKIATVSADEWADFKAGVRRSLSESETTLANVKSDMPG
jgi:hypothetical protein